LTIRYLPPAGHKIYWQEIIQAVIKSLLKKYTYKQDLISPESAHDYFFVNSGTSAIYILLKYLKSISNRQDVLIPAYTCPSVVAAIRKANLNPVLCDLNPFDFSLKFEDFINKISDNTLAVLQVELFGILPDNRKLVKQTRIHNSYFIGDAAQSFGNYLLDADLINNRGYDFLIFSFGRGKPLNLLHGGGIISLDQDSRFNEFTENFTAKINSYSILKSIFNTIFYKLFFNPYFYNIPRSLPFLNLGKTIYRSDFEVMSISPYILNLVELIINRNKSIIQYRMRHTNEINSLLEPVKQHLFITDSKDTYDLIRFPILFKDADLRDKILHDLTRNGIGATGLYPFPIDVQPELKILKLEHCENAEFISKSILTLPIHENLTNTDLKKIEKVLYKYLSIN